GIGLRPLWRQGRHRQLHRAALDHDRDRTGPLPDLTDFWRAGAVPARQQGQGRSMTETSSNGVVAYDVENGIAWVRFNRPEKRNAMSPTLNRDMMEVLDLLEFRDDVGVLVLSGEGPAWTAGMDLKEYFRETEAKGLGATRNAQRESYGWWRRLRWYQKPTIAMVNGWCFGGGYGPLFACDLAFAAEEAKFGL